MDLKRIQAERKKSKVINPKDLFMSLRRDEEFKYLWEVQSTILEQWNDKRHLKDIIVKMNTGAGKTIIALLILQSLMNENGGKSVYVVPDQYLKQQVEKTANKLGVEVTLERRNRMFIEGKAILIQTINELVNGKTPFGMQSSNIAIENIVIDDVHSCVSDIKNQFRVAINNKTKLYQSIFNVFKNEMSSYYKITVDTLESRMSYLANNNFIVPFWMWQEKIPKIVELLEDKQNEELDQIKYNYPLLKDDLLSCRAFFSKDTFVLEPKSTPIHKISSFCNAKHRVFLSATLPDLTIFNSVLNIAEEDVKIGLLHPEKAYDIGERLIIFPEYINPEIHVNEMIDKISKIGKNKNVLILVPSSNLATLWENALKGEKVQVLKANNIVEGINKIKVDVFKGFTIIVNKYDGIDLPNDNCRLIVIHGLPNIGRNFDKYEKEILPESDRISAELIQKIEQGMGRGVRSNTDYCAVILMGTALIDAIYNGDYKKCFSEATLTQIETSECLWDNFESKNIDEIFDVLKYIFDRNTDWMDMNKENLLNCIYDTELKFNDVELLIREMYQSEHKCDYQGAVDKIDKFISSNRLTDEMSAYLLYLKSEVEYHISQSKAQETLKSAFYKNTKIIKPIDGVNYQKIEKTVSTQAEKISNNLKKFNTNNDILIKLDTILTKLKFEEGTSNKFEEAINELATMLGFDSQRPEREYKDGGPDNLWVLDQKCFFVIECKNETKTDGICKTDIAQLLSSCQWFESKYPLNKADYIPVIIHNSNKANSDANPNSKMKVLTPSKLEILKHQIRELFKEISLSNVRNNAIEIKKLIDIHRLTANSINSYFESIGC